MNMLERIIKAQERKARLECPEVFVGPGVETYPEGKLRKNTVVIEMNEEASAIGSKSSKVYFYDVDRQEVTIIDQRGITHCFEPSKLTIPTRIAAISEVNFMLDQFGCGKDYEGTDALADEVVDSVLSGKMINLKIPYKTYFSKGILNIKTLIPYRVVEKSEETKNRLKEIFKDQDIRRRKME